MKSSLPRQTSSQRGLSELKAGLEPPILAIMANMQIGPIGHVSGRLLLAAPSLAEAAAELARAFTARGLEVSVAATGRAALRQAKETRFDLVICDLALPRGSGLDLLRALRDREMRVTAFLLCDAQQPLLEAAQLGAYCLRNPIEIGALLDTVLRRIRNESGTKRRARRRVTEITEAVAATAAKNQFGQLLGAAMQGGRVVITRHDAPSAVILSYEEYRELTSEDSPDLEALSREFDELLEGMQAPAARAASDALFAASPAELGEAARAEARGDTRSPERG